MTRSHLAEVCPDDTLDVAGLLVTELVSNAVLHAKTDMLLVVDVVPGRVELRVQDGSPEEPALQELDVDAATGRGLAIVEELATRVGRRPRPRTESGVGEHRLPGDGAWSANGEVTCHAGELEHLADVGAAATRA